jgi:hypothetical protein
MSQHVRAKPHDHIGSCELAEQLIDSRFARTDSLIDEVEMEELANKKMRIAMKLPIPYVIYFCSPLLLF